MEILIRETPKEVAETAAEVVSYFVKKGAILGLATGSTPLATYRELIRRYEQENLSFASCQAFLLDEYVGLPQDHPQSYYQTIRREFTSHIDIPDEKVFSLNARAQFVEKAAAEYEEAIKKAGGIDIQILGLGTDGHIAFNEPGSSLSSRTRLKTLHPQTISDNSRFFESPEQVPVHVLTQGLGTILEAKNIILLATGEGKAEAVEQLVEGPVRAMFPASILQMHRKVTVVVDKAAASRLSHTSYYEFTDAYKPVWQRLEP